MTKQFDKKDIFLFAAMSRLKTIGKCAPYTGMTNDVACGLLEAIGNLAREPLDDEAEFVASYLDDLEMMQNRAATLARQLQRFSCSPEDSAAITGLWEELE